MIRWQTKCGPGLTRSFATETAPVAEASPLSSTRPPFTPQLFVPQTNHFRPKPTTCTLYDFPNLAPTERYTQYPGTHLGVPLRKDILHKAVVFEQDAMRPVTANVKHRTEVHGSNRKIRPQKGTGRARLGDKKSPMLRGGGKAFGPKPRDMSTELPLKIYDRAWRIALSHRYREGQLLVVDEQINLDHLPVEWRSSFAEAAIHASATRRTLFITKERTSFVDAINDIYKIAKAFTYDEASVTELLKLGRVAIEREALNAMLEEHQSDLNDEDQVLFTQNGPVSLLTGQPVL